MIQTTEFFTEFPAISKKQWLERIARDLKGKPLEELHWQLTETLTVDPFTHADDQDSPPAPLAAQTNSWKINEDILQTDTTAANRQALEALAFGAESLHFQLSETAQLTPLLDRIHPDYISLLFSGKGVTDAPAAVLAALGELAKDRGIPLANLQGGLYYNPMAEPGKLQDWRYVIDLLQYAKQNTPEIRCLMVDGRPAFKGTKHVVDELVGILRQGAVFLDQLEKRGADVNDLSAQLQFCLYIGKSYFVEIAKLRALKLLWLNMLNVWGAKPVYPVLDIRFAPGAYTGELYTNMIRATTMAMSAAIGGADRITVLPYDAGREAQAQYPATFSRRIARNVQHLLKLESGFDVLADPAAGSFYIEKLTNQLAESAWKNLDL